MKSKSLLKAAVSVTLILHLTACGTLLYPERKGQTGGRIDAGAVLHGAGPGRHRRRSRAAGADGPG